MNVENTDTDWKEDWRKENDARLAKQKERFVQLYNCLLKLNVARVRVAYYGFGDEGCVKEITYLDAQEKEMEPFGGQNGSEINAPTKADVSKEELEELIEEFVCEALPRGWEIDEGSSGTVTMDVPGKTLSFDHKKLISKYQKWEEQWHIPTITP